MKMVYKINYLSKRIKAGIGSLILVASLSSCSFKEEKEIIELGVTCSWNDQYSDYSGGEKVIIKVCDANNFDYIEGIEFEIKDIDGKVIDRFTSNNDKHVVNGVKIGNTYTLRELSVPGGYLLEKSIYSFTMNSNSNIEYLDDDYYDSYSVMIIKEKVEDRILKKYNYNGNGKFSVMTLDGNYCNIPGITFEVVDDEGNLVEKWVSTTTVHVVDNLSDGNYKIMITDLPEEYNAEGVLNQGGDIVSITNDILFNGGYSVSIIDGKYSANKSYSGPAFYFSSTKEKLDIKTYKRSKAK